MNLNSPEQNPVVFRILLVKCVRDLRAGAEQLRGRIVADMGNAVELSASSLAQEALRVLEHVQMIRYTKEYFKPSVSPPEIVICTAHIRTEQKFQNAVVKRLSAIAAPEHESAQNDSGLLEKVRKQLENFLPGEAAEEDERHRMEIGRIADIAPELQPVLDNIIVELNALLREIEALPAPSA